MVVRIAVCCTSPELPMFQQEIGRFSEKQPVRIYTEFYQESSDFLDALNRESLWDFLAIALPGARGMETVVGARELAPETPLLWCSNDAEFAVASYRLHCSLFLPLPLKPGDVKAALRRCLGDSLSLYVHPGRGPNRRYLENKEAAI